jgi:hypothetical protein
MLLVTSYLDRPTLTELSVAGARIGFQGQLAGCRNRSTGVT